MNKPIIPVFYACDERFLKFTVVSIRSIIDNASSEYNYRFYILHSGIPEDKKAVAYELCDGEHEIIFCDVAEHINKISDNLPIRDYYSKTTYYRLFIAEMFPEYEKAIYIDSDTVVMEDISELYNTEIEDNYLGACHEQAMIQVDAFGEYAERVVGVSRYNFFNAGVLLINCEEFRLHRALDKFVRYLQEYNFVVTQDEDYLNLICKDHVYWLDGRWNTEVFGEIPHDISEAKVIHYIMTNKPWHYSDCRHGTFFWEYAKRTSVHGEIAKELSGYTDAQKERDRLSAERLIELAVSETNREDNFQGRMNGIKRAQDRVKILRKIEEYERAGRFDEDVEDDPPPRELLPDEIDYVKKRAIERLKTKFAYMIARRFLYDLIDGKKLIIKEIKGIEHFRGLKSGAVITCNHFNALDSFAIQLAYEAAEQQNRKLYRVIREGNYTSFPGFYGFLMRNCNTLPLSSNRETLHKFSKAMAQILGGGDLVLVYPEQSMWWNYRKPKPLKSGAYLFAAKNNVPVLPCFITMKDSDIIGDDGFPVQEYTVNISEPIYPDEGVSYRTNMNNMMEKNSEVWKNIYEAVYSIPLSYTTEKAK